MSGERPTRPAEEPSGLRLALTLGFAGLLSGLALVVAYEATLPAIKANEVRAIESAVFEVVPGSTSVQRLAPDGAGALRELAPGEDVPHVYAAYDSGGKLQGYAIGGKGPGFQDTIRLLYGYDPATSRLTGLAIIDSRETPGLGDKIYKDPAFREEFRELGVKPRVELVKGHGSAPNQVDAITGATISSRAVVSIVNASNDEWLELLPSALGANPSEGANPVAGGKQ